jgi:hypothetical protein
MATTFWLLVALIIAIVAAAVGGGVGGSMAVNNAKTQCLASSSAAAAAQSTSGTDSPAAITANPTETSISPESLGFSAGKQTTAWGPLQTSLPYTGCPANSGSTYTSYFPNSKFKIYCGLDILFTGTSDLMYVVTPTFELCMEACASFNENGRKNAGATTACGGVAFVPSHVNGDEQGMPADCILKYYPNVTSMLRPNQKYVVDSAVLQ